MTKRELNVIASGLNIKKPSKLSSNEIINIFRRFLTIKKLEDLGLNNFSRRHIQFNELDRVLKLKELSLNVLKKLGKLQEIKNFNSLSKKDLIYSL